jgi:hypothetical protein
MLWSPPWAAGQATETVRPGSGSAARPTAARSRRTAWGSVTAPRIQRGPPQRAHPRISSANTRWRRRAPGPPSWRGVGYFCFAVAPGLGGARAGAALIGLGIAAWHPPAMGALSMRFPERRATALSIHGMGATISDTLTPLAVGALLVVVFWRDFLHAQLFAGITAALLVWLGLARQFTQPVPRSSGGSLARDGRAILTNPAFLAVSFADGLMAMARQVSSRSSHSTSRSVSVATRSSSACTCPPARYGHRVPARAGSPGRPDRAQGGAGAVVPAPRRRG